MEINIFPCGDITQKIQNAIDEVSKKGGGKVVLNNGEYLLKSILLKSNVCSKLRKNEFYK